MRGINGFNFLNPGAKQTAHDLAKAVAAVRDWKQVKRIVWPDFAPSPSDGLGGGAGGQGAFEFVWSD